jgi:hypothetical protein
VKARNTYKTAGKRRMARGRWPEGLPCPNGPATLCVTTATHLSADRNGGSHGVASLADAGNSSPTLHHDLAIASLSIPDRVARLVVTWWHRMLAG